MLVPSPVVSVQVTQDKAVPGYVVATGVPVDRVPTCQNPAVPVALYVFLKEDENVFEVGKLIDELSEDTELKPICVH